MMPEKVTGYLTKDGRFYENFDLCRLEDAKLVLSNQINGGIKQEVIVDDFYDILNLYTDEALEYLNARKAVLAATSEIEDDEPDTRPIEVEK